MPKIEKLDNLGNPTGIFKRVSDAHWIALRRLKNLRWRLVEADKPKLSRKEPVYTPVIEGFPEKKEDQFKWVDEQKTINVLELAANKTNSLALKEKIKNRIEILKAQTN